MAIRGGWLQLLQTGSVMPVLKELCLRAVPSLLSSASAASRAGGMQRAAAATARGAIEVTDDARRHALNVGELSLDLCACDGSGNQPKHCQSFTCNLSRHRLHAADGPEAVSSLQPCCTADFANQP
jgi:hypothetical protein